MVRQATRAGGFRSCPRAREYKPIEMPKNSAIGFVNAFFAVVTGFALIWHIWWMAGVGLLGTFTAFLVFAFRAEEEVEIPVEQIAQFDVVTLREVRCYRNVMVLAHDIQSRKRCRCARHGSAGPASASSLPTDWIFMKSDIVMFSALFAAYAVLVARDCRRCPTGPGLFNLEVAIAIETGCTYLRQLEL